MLTHPISSAMEPHRPMQMSMLIAVLVLASTCCHAVHLAEVTLEMEEHSTECFYEWVSETHERVTVEFQVGFLNRVFIKKKPACCCCKVS